MLCHCVVVWLQLPENLLQYSPGISTVSPGSQMPVKSAVKHAVAPAPATTCSGKTVRIGLNRLLKKAAKASSRNCCPPSSVGYDKCLKRSVSVRRIFGLFRQETCIFSQRALQSGFVDSKDFALRYPVLCESEIDQSRVGSVFDRRFEPAGDCWHISCKSTR
jgi:hypothetical protein